MKVRLATIKLAKARSLVGVPLVKENEVIGGIAIYRQEVRPLSEKQVELLKSFAAQAVIAIENAQLLNELRQRTTNLAESLEQQTATSEVLQVISSAPGELEPVFSAMLEKAARISDAKFGGIYRWDGDALHLIAAHNTPPEFAEYRRRTPLRPDPKSPSGRMIAAKTVVHVADVTAEQAYTEHRVPATVAAVELGGVRTALLVPMLKENDVIGTVAFVPSRGASLYRQTDRVGHEFRRPSRYRHRERAAAQWAARSHYRSRQLLRRCSKSLAVLPATCSLCSPPCWRRPSVSAMPNSVTFTAGMAMLCI